MVKEITCPRCLGNGYVDFQDMVRLEREYYWEEGECGFCNETGSVEYSFARKFNANDLFFNMENWGSQEYKLYVSGDPVTVQNHRQEFFHISQLTHAIVNLLQKGLNRDTIQDILINELEGGTDEESLRKFIVRVYRRHMRMLSYKPKDS